MSICHCGLPLHYNSKKVEDFITNLIKELRLNEDLEHFQRVRIHHNSIMTENFKWCKDADCKEKARFWKGRQKEEGKC